MTVVLTRAARSDLIELYEFVASDNPTVARRIVARIVAVIEQIDAGAIAGPEVRLTDGRRVQYWPVLPYRVYYRRTPRQTAIVRVYHGARRPIEQPPS